MDNVNKVREANAINFRWNRLSFIIKSDTFPSIYGSFIGEWFGKTNDTGNQDINSQ